MSKEAALIEKTAAGQTEAGASTDALLSDEFQGLNLIELNEKLEPIAYPDPVSLWPQTEIWSWISIFVLILLLRLAYRALLRWQANAYRRAAYQEAKAAANDTTVLANILRRTALAAYPRSEVASLYGDDWLQFLEQHCAGLNFRDKHGRQLIETPYLVGDQPPASTELTQLCLAWIEGHTDSPVAVKETKDD